MSQAIINEYAEQRNILGARAASYADAVFKLQQEVEDLKKKVAELENPAKSKK
jgi:hypothetical protein